MTRWLPLSLILILALLTTVAPGAEPEKSIWTTDYPKALKRAAKEEKPLLLLFTGTNWCPSCRELERSVLNTEYFKTKGPEKFVLVYLDFPTQTANPKPTKLSRQNEALQDKFQIGPGPFPVLLLLDPKARVYGRTTYKPVGPKIYFKNLEAFDNVIAKRDSLFAKADKSTKGLKRAQLLDQAISVVADHADPVGYEPQIQQIIDIDADNAAGLKAKYDSRRRIKTLDDLMTLRMWDKVIAGIEQLDNDYQLAPEDRQRLFHRKAIAHLEAKQYAQVDKALSTSIDADPLSRTADKLRFQLVQLRQYIRELPADQRNPPTTQPATTIAPTTQPATTDAATTQPDDAEDGAAAESDCADCTEDCGPKQADGDNDDAESGTAEEDSAAESAESTETASAK